MADIEDAFETAVTISASEREAAVKVKVRLNPQDESFYGDSFVSGTRSIFVRTWGCAHNTSDSEYMSGLLSAAGYNVVSTKEDASLWILNSCTVKTPSEVQLENNVKEAKKAGKLLVVAGCVSQAEPDSDFLRGVSVIGVKQIDRIVEVVNETFKGNCVRILSRKRPEQKLSLPKMRRNDLIEEDASLWILNSCTVKTPSEVQLENNVKEAKKAGKLLVVAGCVSQAEPDSDFLRGVSVIGVKQIDRIVEVVNETFKGNCVRILSRKRPEQKLSLPKMRRNDLIEVLAINSGCLNHCTYCKTKQARGNLVSYPLEELVAQARRAFTEGCRELWLTSEDLGAWGRDIGMVLPDLLNAIVQVIPEGCMMRLGMTNPPYILDFLHEIAKTLNHPRVYSFLHIPVQSGSDAVLREMKREYCNAEFCRVVDFMLKNVPNVYIATDFICAFPSETLEDFEESMQLVRKYRFPSLFVNQFYPRRGTPAARLKRIDTAEARRRTALMSSLFRSYTRYGSDRVGAEYEVLVAEWATDKLHFVAHNKSYEHFLVPSDDASILGKVVRVRVTGVAKFHMNAELVRASGAEDRVEQFASVSASSYFGVSLHRMRNKCLWIHQNTSNATFIGFLVSVLISLLYLLFNVR
ncbi:Threonylcarbamoyladenosine tRNA methylthiotransferase [Toxocara canis]|uniref:Threonylcarbamoyladenosine tRNA methylthiotransferase n=1 Tax=Toxocara canis TaxID=6265 RepID=A0A0B2V8N8_TOXCA|nr:Threonylcarbamoyladenosine tRNA methylthiotransferase [Toxocara canis]